MVFLDPSHADQVLARTRAFFGGPRRAPLTERTVAAARQVLDSQRLGWRRYLAFAGPDKKTLYVVGTQAAWKIDLLTPGFAGRAK